MKHIYLSVLLVFSSCAVFGQETMLGIARIEDYGSGGIFRLPLGKDSMEIELFFSIPLSEGVGQLLEHSNGRIYGVTCRGGIWNKGAIYSTNGSGEDFTLDYHFGNDNDFIPRAGLVEGDGGHILGIRGAEETKGIGEVYQFDPVSSEISVIRQFTLLEASGTISPLLIGSDRMIYGTSPYGGLEGHGSIFRLNQDGTGFELIHEFDGDGNSFPSPELIEHVNGKIYGINRIGFSWGGFYGAEIFRINKDGSDFESLESLPQRHIPSGKLLSDQNGNIYGVFPERGAFFGGGVFKTDSLGKRYQTLYHFDYQEEEGKQFPFGGLILGKDGLLYGVCSGKVYPNSGGAAFRINRYGEDFEWLKTFDHYHGNNPKECLIQTASGHFFGTTTRGGLDDKGVIYGFDLETDTIAVYKELRAASIGRSPRARLLKLSEDRVVGLTYAGGESRKGVLFSADNCGRNIEVLHQFDILHFMLYRINIIVGKDHKIYGTMLNYLGGELFSLNQDGSDWKIIYDFNGIPGSTYKNILQTDDGKLFGLSFLINSDETYGEIFSIETDGTGFALEFQFDSTGSEVYPSGDLMEHSNGDLYGTQKEGVFRYNRTSKAMDVFNLGSYEEPDFSMDGAPLLEGTDGRLYGMGLYFWGQASATQKNPQGFLYSFKPDGTDFQNHFLFTAAQGIYPSGGISANGDGTLFFSTSNTHKSWSPSESYFGTLFKYNPQDSGIEVVQFFDENLGIIPYGPPIFTHDSCLAEVKRLEPSEYQEDSTIHPLAIFPNPTSETFEVHSGVEGIGEVLLRDLQGRFLLSHPLDPQTGSTSINMRPFPSGTYLITISTSETTTTHKVVKW